MYGKDLHAAFRHHISRDGRVDAPRKHEHPASGTPHGQPARTGKHIRIDESAAVLAYVHLEVAVVFRKIHPESARRKHSASEGCGDLGRSHGDALVRTFHRDAERDLALRTLRSGGGSLSQRSAYLREILLRTHRHLVRDGKGVYAEHPLQTGEDLGAVLLREILHEISPLRLFKAVFHPRKRAFDVAHEHGLEIIAVFPFQEQFAESYHYNSLHFLLRFSSW